MLRKLTPLSRIDFGYHRGKTVGQILQATNGKSYMTWLYFNASHIDLSDELKSELKIEHILEKPGKDPETYGLFYRDCSEFINKIELYYKDKRQKSFFEKRVTRACDKRYTKIALIKRNRTKI